MEDVPRGKGDPGRVRFGAAGEGSRLSVFLQRGNRAGRGKEAAEGSPAPPGSPRDTPGSGEPFTVCT